MMDMGGAVRMVSQVLASVRQGEVGRGGPAAYAAPQRSS